MYDIYKLLTWSVYSGKAGTTSGGPGARFSTKSDAAGAAAYIMGIVQQPVPIIPDTEQIQILVRSSGPGGPMAADVEWCRDSNDDVYRCVVASPKKESKLKGLKSFIAYQLTPTVCYLFCLLCSIPRNTIWKITSLPDVYFCIFYLKEKFVF